MNTIITDSNVTSRPNATCNILTANAGISTPVATGGLIFSGTGVNSGATPISTDVRFVTLTFTGVGDTAQGATVDLVWQSSYISASKIINAIISGQTVTNATSVFVLKSITAGSGSVTFKCQNAGEATSGASTISILAYLLN